jgi:S1-C subfamily serine protease
VNLAGQTADASVVLFDPELDVAVLHVPSLSGLPLRFAATDPGRGTIGAALGYPGGGALTIEPAAVAGRYDARGRDIYGRAPVTRSILELRAQIEQGDSGGPFVLADGTVGGLVFAESRADEDVGYALSAMPVSIRIAPAIGRASPVDTGPCL